MKKVYGPVLLDPGDGASVAIGGGRGTRVVGHAGVVALLGEAVARQPLRAHVGERSLMTPATKIDDEEEDEDEEESGILP